MGKGISWKVGFELSLEVKPGTPMSWNQKVECLTSPLILEKKKISPRAVNGLA